MTPPPSDARRLAHEVLCRVAESEAFADVVLAHRLEGANLSPADAALATRLVYGTLAWQGRLDHHLATLVRQPLPQLEAGVLVALRLGLFQLLFTRVPAYAAVNGSVELARGAGSGRGAGGLANAVLRKAAATGIDGFVLPAASDPMARAAVEWSHPRWLVERWAAEFGVDALPALLAAHNDEGELALRANPQRTTREALATTLADAGVATKPARFARHALVVTGGAARVTALDAFRRGDCAFHGEASQLVVDLLDPQPGERVLDACAAPGGKSNAIAERVGDGGHVVALDVHRAGARRIRTQARRLHTGVTAVVADARRPPLARAFDRVLVDAPCSGLGTLRRHPELRWRRTDADIPRLAALQLEILTAVAPLVRPGGVMVYAVCTRTQEETDGVIDAFLRATPGFVADDAASWLPAAVVTDGALRTMPFQHGLDGFFATRLRRDTNTPR